MTIKEILDYALPMTDEERKCLQSKTKWQHKRMELTRMIQAYKEGKDYKSPMLIAVDLDEIRKMLNN